MKTRKGIFDKDFFLFSFIFLQRIDFIFLGRVGFVVRYDTIKVRICYK